MFYGATLTDNVKKIIEIASEFGNRLGETQVASEHLLYGITAADECAASRLLLKYNITKSSLLSVFEYSGFSAQNNSRTMEINFTPRSKEIFNKAYMLSLELGQTFICTEHLLFSILSDSNSVAVKILASSFKVNIEDIKNELMYILTKNSHPEQIYKAEEKTNENKHLENEGMSGSNIKSNLPEALLELGSDLTLKAKQHKIDPIIGREKEIERIVEILCRKTKNNPVLIGEAGVGKSAVVEGLALAINAGEVPEILKDKSIYSLEIGSLMAGTKYRGALEEKLKEVIRLIQENKNIIVFIDEIHTLATAGHTEGEVNPADMLKPYLSRGELQTIGATTTDEYRKFIEKDKALERRFQPIMVNPPSVDETILILKGIRDSYEAFHKVKITDEAIVAAATLSDRYIMDRSLPDKAIDLIDEAASKAKVMASNEPSDIKKLRQEIAKLEVEQADAVISENYEKSSKLTYQIKNLKTKLEDRETDLKAIKKLSGGEVSGENIAQIVASWTGIPVMKLNESEKQRLINLESILHKRVIGQFEAVEAVSKAIRRARAGLKDENKPIGSFLFLGPTGVGKTELSKALAEAMFNNEEQIIRLDMSEYMEAHSVAKLIGSPPGYVGHEDGGQLTEAVRRKQYSVVLFDEIEKAHNDVYNMLLQILDDGRLTDSHGKVVNFKNTIIILTSNVGAMDAMPSKKKFGFAGDLATENLTKEERKNLYMQAVKRQFKPEFINRIDSLVIFDSLTREDIAKITNLFLNKVITKLAKQEIYLKISDKALLYIITHGYSEEYGARPLKRLIQNEVEDVLAEKILTNIVVKGNEVVIDEENGKLVFKV